MVDTGDDFVPSRDLPGYDLARAKRYSRTKLAASMAGSALSISRTLWFARSGRSARLRRWSDGVAPAPVLADATYVLAEGAASWLATLPIGYAAGYRIERHYDLTKQPPSRWLIDQLKSLAVGLALQVPLTVGAYRVIRRRPQDWWLILSGATVPLVVGLSYLAPTVLMPIFNRFEPLNHPELTARITSLSTRANVPIAAVLRMDMSRQSEKPNAFFTGLGNSKRIVLGDTLLAKFSPDEIEGVVAHELGHQVHGDIWRFVGLAGGLGIVGAWAISRVAPGWIRRNARATGVDEIGDIASLPLMQLLLSVGGLLAGPLLAAFTRTIERRTDAYALRLTGDGASYATAMGRLAMESLADPDPPRPLVLLLASHPPIAHRIRAARAFERTRPSQNGDEIR